ncbi:MAG TPA: alpha/beta fold hydrolase [Chloroflexia bacterium]|nr:alpha/beta fold hydrolase [Chloroflexia bacterium]
MAESTDRRSGFAEINGANLYYAVEGTGRPLVLLHAGVSDHRMWDAVVPALAARYQVIRYDHRGFGRSSFPAGPFALEEDLYGLLQHLGVPRAFVAGVSMGGRTAIDFTLAHPDRVAALIPVAAGLSGGPPPSEADQAAAAPFMAAYEAAAAAQDLERILDLEMDVWLIGPGRSRAAVDPAVQARFREIEAANLARELAGEGKDAQSVALDPPAAGRLGEIQVPALVMVGTADVPKCVRDADVIAAGITGARKIVLPDVAHMVPMEAPATFNRHLLDFLDTL